MQYLTNEKLTIVGAGGMIGSNMVQCALMLGLTPNICLYDIFEPGVHGVADEMAHCGFPGANITWTTNPEEAFTGAKYIVSSGGAPRKEGMTREDLLKGNCQIAAEFGDFIKKYCPEYNLTRMFEDENDCGYVHQSVKKPYIRCAIEYTFNEDDSLSVRVPANSISFDESTYTLDSITPLKYFGAGNMTDEGFIFFPDGTGTVVDFEDFYDQETGKSENILVNVDRLFGPDYCYSSINGAHREQVTMPVYGLVGTVTPNKATEEILDGVGAEYDGTLKTGYFAILEEGASLATLSVFSLVATHKYGNVYASYTPYPQDTFDLSQTLSVGSATKYKMVAKTK